MNDGLDLKLNWTALQNELKKAPEKVKVRELRRVMRAELSVVVQSVRQFVPVRKKTSGIKRTFQKRGAAKSSKILRAPGNLKKSIGIIASRKTATLFVRPLFGASKKYDGFYGHMVHNGTVNTKTKTAFMDQAYAATKSIVGANLSAKVTKSIAKSLSNLGAKV